MSTYHDDPVAPGAPVYGGPTTRIPTGEPDPLHVEHQPPPVAAPGEATTARMDHGAAPAPRSDDQAGHHGGQHAGLDDVAQRFAPVEQRAKLLLAIAAMTALALLFSLVTMLSQLTEDRGPEPVLVEGVPCLVEEVQDGEAVLFCQR
jgi:hypothetical protein